ncbi:MFS general substrate transporter [Coprinopsis marcescibilis]|uniref:MFS general substrate transporter n=1 Tax=Coprinopsis marcescibilis TaxID=230819 RepID=A0A5C3LBK8_COPMA|nr:MFS general substrate transporter [Coprinopsis marcescibilis]
MPPTRFSQKKASVWKAELDIDQIVPPPAPYQLPRERHPRNWSKPRRIFIVCIICNLLLPIEMFPTLYVGAQPQIQSYFSSSFLLVTMGVGLVNLAIAFGSLLGAPLSGLIGRRLTYILSSICFTGFATGSALAPNITACLVFRFCAALFGSTAIPIFNHTVSDLFTPEERVPLTAIFTTLLYSAPTFGPVPASLMGQHVSWRWIIALSAFWAALFAVVLLFLPETDLNVIKRLYRASNEGVSPYQVCRTQFRTKDAWQTLLTPLTMLVLEPIFLFTMLYYAFVHGVFFILLQVFPLFYRENYEFSLSKSGLVFLAPWIGNLIGAVVYFAYLQPKHTHRRQQLQYKNDQILAQNPHAYVQVELKPETRLPGLLIGVVSISGGLVWFGLTSTPRLNFMVPIASGVPIGAGLALVNISLLAYCTDLYPSLSSSVIIAGLFVRSLYAAFAPSFAVHMFQNIGRRNSCLILAGICLAGLPAGCVLWACGSQVRFLSKRAAQDESYVMRDVTLGLDTYDNRKDSGTSDRKPIRRNSSSRRSANSFAQGDRLLYEQPGLEMAPGPSLQPSYDDIQGPGVHLEARARSSNPFLVEEIPRSST